MSKIITITKCGICQKEFTGPEDLFKGAAALPVGTTQSRAAQFVGVLIAHMLQPSDEREHKTRQRADGALKFCQCMSCTEHRRVLDIAGHYSQELRGMLILSYFESQDEDLIRERDFLRWKLQVGSRRAFVPDEIIAAKADELIDRVERLYITDASTAKTQARGELIALMSEMRDVLYEKGRYKLPEGIDRMWPGTPLTLPPNFTF